MQLKGMLEGSHYCMAVLQGAAFLCVYTGFVPPCACVATWDIFLGQGSLILGR